MANPKKGDPFLVAGGNSHIFWIFHPYFGKMNPFWRAYFSDGLLGGGFKYFWFSSIFGEDFQFD